MSSERNALNANRKKLNYERSLHSQKFGKIWHKTAEITLIILPALFNLRMARRAAISSQLCALLYYV